MINKSDIYDIIFWSYLHARMCCIQEWLTSIAFVFALLKRLICVLTKIVVSDVRYGGMGTSAHTPISYITAAAMEVTLLIVGTWKNESRVFTMQQFCQVLW